MVEADVRERLLEAEEAPPEEPAEEPTRDSAAPAVPEQVQESGQPWVTHFEPNHGPVDGGTEIRLQGTSFSPDVRVLFDAEPATVVTHEETSLVVQTPERRPAATVDIRVVNPDGLEHLMIQAFHYDGAPFPASVEPARAPVHGGVACMLRGAAFQPGVRLRLGAAEVACQFHDETRIDFSTPPHPEGIVDLEVMNPDGQRAALAGAFRFDGPPVIEALEPEHGPATGCRVTLVGRNFDEETRAALLPERALAASFIDSTRIAVDLPARPGAGPVTLDLVNPDGQHAQCQFLYDASPPPRLDAVEPPQGPVEGGGQVALRGAHFDGAAAVFFGTTPATVIERSAERLVVEPPAAPGPGLVDVRVENCDQTSSRLEQAFRYGEEPQVVERARVAVSAVVPDHGPSVGGTRVVVRGIGFTRDARVLLGGERAASQRFLDDTAIEIVTHPARRPGAIDVQVASASGDAQLAQGYRFDPSPPPRIDSVVPNRLAAAGGEKVTLLGQGFASSARVLIAGQAAKVRSVDGSKLEVTAPAGTRGTMADVEVRHPDGQRAVKPRACMFT